MTTTPAVALKSAFLDTNALVNLFAFWEACRAAEVRLDSVGTFADLKTALAGRVRLARTLSHNDYDHVRTGLTCFQNLRQGRERYLFFTSRLCRSELHHVISTSLALDRLARRRVPHSLRIKRPQVIYRRALEASDYDNLSRQQEEFFEGLRVDYDLDIPEVEDPAKGPLARYESILETARQVWSRILIEVMDAYVYAAAVEIDADVFITADEALRDALQRFNQPDAQWQGAARSLKAAIGKRPGDPLPQMMRPTGALP